MCLLLVRQLRGWKSRVCVSPAQPCAPGASPQHGSFTAHCPLSGSTVNLVTLTPNPELGHNLSKGNLPRYETEILQTQQCGDLSAASSSAKAPVQQLREQSSSSVLLPCVPSHSPCPPAPVQMETLLLITPSIKFSFCCDCFLLSYSLCLGLRKKSCSSLVIAYSHEPVS